MSEKSCRACAHSYLEPDASYPVCGHKDAGTFGVYTHRATQVEKDPTNEGIGHCGPERSKFEQHPLRNPDGTFKSDTKSPT